MRNISVDLKGHGYGLVTMVFAIFCLFDFALAASAKLDFHGTVISREKQKNLDAFSQDITIFGSSAAVRIPVVNRKRAPNRFRIVVSYKNGFKNAHTGEFSVGVAGSATKIVTFKAPQGTKNTVTLCVQGKIGADKWRTHSCQQVRVSKID